MLCNISAGMLYYYLQNACHHHRQQPAHKIVRACMQTAHNYAKQDQLFHMVLHLPVALAAVSAAVQNILAQEFGRVSICIPNAVDCQRFFPGPPADIAPSFILTTVKGQVQLPRPSLQPQLLAKR